MCFLQKEVKRIRRSEGEYLLRSVAFPNTILKPVTDSFIYYRLKQNLSAFISIGTTKC
jgi:hypothetical protein